MKKLGFPFYIVVIFGHSRFVLFQRHLKEFMEVRCLVSVDKLFRCRCVDGKKD